MVGHIIIFLKLFLSQQQKGGVQKRGTLVCFFFSSCREMLRFSVLLGDVFLFIVKIASIEEKIQKWFYLTPVYKNIDLQWFTNVKGF